LHGAQCALLRYATMVVVLALLDIEVHAVPDDSRAVIRGKKKLDGQNFFEAPVKPRRG
jgi:hypothetical protein